MSDILNEGYREIDELEQLAQLIIDWMVDKNSQRLDAVYRYRKGNPPKEKIPLEDEAFSKLIRDYFEFSKPVVSIKEASKYVRFRVINNFVAEQPVTVEFSNRTSSRGVYMSQGDKGGKIVMKLDSKPFSDLLRYQIDFDISRGATSASNMSKVLATCLGATMRPSLIHELQHAYDDWRSRGRYHSDPESRDYYKRYSGRNADDRGEERILSPEQWASYVKLPHEYWARFSTAVKEVFSVPDDYKRPWSDIQRRFRREFVGYNLMPEQVRNRLWKALWKYYTERKPLSRRLMETAKSFGAQTMDIHRLLTYAKSWEGFIREFGRRFGKMAKDGKTIEQLKDLWSSYHPNEIPVVAEERIPGGKSSGMTLEKIAQLHGVERDEIVQQFKAGIRVEMEHTNDTNVAKEIVMDHLVEDPLYYTLLKKVGL